MPNAASAVNPEDPESQEETGVLQGVLTAAMASWIDDDLPRFFAELTALASSLRDHGPDIRKALLRNEELRSLPETARGFPIGAVDCAIVPQAWGDVVTLLALGARILPSTEPEYIICRKTASNTDAMRQLAPALRLQAETALIAGAQAPVIVDNSWWSVLMDTNKMITAHE